MKTKITIEQDGGRVTIVGQSPSPIIVGRTVERAVAQTCLSDDGRELPYRRLVPTSTTTRFEFDASFVGVVDVQTEDR